MTRRPGLSLTEVLVTLFILAIGVIGVLTMFPVGAVQMGLALKDQRCAEAALQADGYMRWYWRHYVVEAGVPSGSINEPLWKALNGGAVQWVTNPSPSPPVVVDPMGCIAPWGAAFKTHVAGVTIPFNIPRVTFSTMTSNALALRTCTLLDGFTYNASGSGIPATSGGAIERENRYNWFWVVQRPSNAQPYTANMSVVVFDKRAYLYAPPNAEVKATATFATGQTSVVLTPFQGVQRGSWIMDASVAGGVQLADFYRVVSVNNTTGQAELQVPANIPLGGSTATLRSTNSAVIPAGVAEVFSRPQLTQDVQITP